MSGIRVTLFLSLLSLLPISSGAQELFHTSALQIGTGHIGSTSPFAESVDPFNPSLMSEITQFGADVSYMMPYSLKDLQQVDAKVAVSTRVCHIQAEVLRSGNEYSAFTLLGGGLSRRFYKFGIGLEYRAVIHTMSNNEKYVSSFSRFGIHINPTENWTFSAAVQNIENRQMSYEYTSVDLQPIAMIGLKWKANDMFALQAEVEKRWDRDAVGKLAVTIIPIPQLFATVGFMSRGSTLSAGVGYIHKFLTINAAMSYHAQLGVSSGATISIVNPWGNN